MPLPSQCRWIDWEDGYASLDWLYGCVAAVRQKDGYVETRVTWQQHEHYGRAASMAQARKFVERWISARRGFPGYVRRNPIRGWDVSKAGVLASLHCTRPGRRVVVMRADMDD